MFQSKTPEITVKDARTLLASIKTSTVVGLRDRAIVGILVYTAARAGAVASLKRGSFYHAGDQWMHFDEKGGNSREIPVRHDLEQMVFEYMQAAGVHDTAKDTLLFRTAYRKTGRLTNNAMYDETDVLERMRTMRQSGMSFDRIAMALNSEGIATPTAGKRWHGFAVNQILARSERR